MTQPNASEAAGCLVATVLELSSAPDLQTIADVVKRAAWRLVGADGATFVLREGAECHYLDEEAISPLWKGRKFPLAACISGWSMLHRQQVVIPDVYGDSRVPHEAYRPTFVRSLVMTPVDSVQPWAAIGVYWAQPTTLTPEQAQWLRALADCTTVAMENVRVRAELDRAVTPGPPEQPSRSRMVPMCAWTRRFLWEDSWMTIEEFLQRRFALTVTHTISEEGLKSLNHAPDRDE